MDIQTFCNNLAAMVKFITDEKIVYGIPEQDWNVTRRLINQTINVLMTTCANEEINRENTRLFSEILAKRWELISGTDFAYPHAPDLPANLICLMLAQELEPIHGKSRYQLLMPTITVSFNEASATGLNEKSLELKEFILSDDNQRIIDILPCLEFAEEDGVLKHTSLFDGNAKTLSEHEAHRVINHSQYTKAYYQSISDLIEMKTRGMSFGAVLNRLMESLCKGGVHGKNGGAELNAAAVANEQIFYFSEWLATLTENDRAKLDGCTAPGLTNNFGQIWGRLARPTDTNYVSAIYCVELIAGQLSQILAHNHWLFDLYPENAQAAVVKYCDQVINDMKHKHDELVSALHKPEYVVTSRYNSNSDNPINDEKMLSYLKSLIVSYDDLLNAMHTSSEMDCQFLLNLMDAHFIQGKVNISSLENLSVRKRGFLVSKFGSIFIDQADNGRDLAAILVSYPQSERLAVCMRYSDKFNRSFTAANEIISLLEMLKIDDRMNVATNLFDIVSKIRNINELVRIFCWIDDKDKPLLMSLCEEKIRSFIRSFHHLERVYAQMPQDFKFKFLEEQSDWIFDYVMDGVQLKTLLIRIPLEQRIKVLNMIGEDMNSIIQISEQLILILEILGEHDQICLIDMMRKGLQEIIMDEVDLESVAKTLKESARAALTAAYHHPNESVIKNVDVVMSQPEAARPDAGGVFAFFNQVRNQIGDGVSRMFYGNQDQEDNKSKRRLV